MTQDQLSLFGDAVESTGNDSRVRRRREREFRYRQRHAFMLPLIESPDGRVWCTCGERR